MSDTSASEAGPDEDGALERVVEDVKETAQEAATFVTRLGGALSEGFQDGRTRP